MNHNTGSIIITTNVTGNPEVVGDAALLFDPRDKAAFVSALTRIGEDEKLRRRLRERRFSMA